MSIVSLVSGGLDSTLMSVLIDESKVLQHPLFINYGQHAETNEWAACLDIFKKFFLPTPIKADMSGFGKIIHSGLTDKTLDIVEDVFLPNRNLMFLLVASSYATQVGADTIAIGLLNEEFHIFEDQTKLFLNKTSELLTISLETDIKIIAPLMEFSKRDVIELCKQKGIDKTYSCHKGDELPCGICVACREIINANKEA